MSGTSPDTDCHREFHSAVCENSQFQFQQTDFWKIFHPESEQRTETAHDEIPSLKNLSLSVNLSQ